MQASVDSNTLPFVARVPGSDPTCPEGLAVPGHSSRKALFLDRDGVVNVNLGYVHSARETEWLPGIFELCEAARAAGYLLVVITNQAGIARGRYNEQVFIDYTRWVHAEFASRGTPIAVTFYCPHHPTAGVGLARIDCECRKPRPGMILAAAAALDLELENCIMVGDQLSDMEAARLAGVPRRILLCAADTQASSTAVHSLFQIPAMLGWGRSNEAGRAQ